MFIFTALILLVPTVIFAQTKSISHHVDFLETNSLFHLMRFGLSLFDAEHPVAGIAGYHFTVLKMKRLNTIGLGVSSMLVNSTNSTPLHQDIAITAPVINLRLGKLSYGDKVPSPTFFFNINYGYGLIHKEHGIFMGISFGSTPQTQRGP